MAEARRPSYFTIIPDPTSRGGYRIDYPLQGRAFHVGEPDARLTVLSLLQAEELDGDLKIGACPPVGAHLDTWIDRGWLCSLTLLAETIGTRYLDLSDPNLAIRENVLAGYNSRQGPPPQRLQYTGKQVRLPQADTTEVAAELLQPILQRRTRRVFTGTPVDLASVSNTLYHGLRPVREAREAAFKADKLGELISFGGAFDFYAVAFDVSGLASGVYRYAPESHSLFSVSEASLREDVSNILMQQPAPQTCSLSLFLVADYDWQMWRYRHSRALLNLYCDAGRVAQRVIIYGERFGFSSFPTPAINDSQAALLLRLPDSDRFNAIYSVSMGPQPQK